MIDGPVDGQCSDISNHSKIGYLKIPTAQQFCSFAGCSLGSHGFDSGFFWCFPWCWRLAHHWWIKQFGKNTKKIMKRRGRRLKRSGRRIATPLSPSRDPFRVVVCPDCRRGNRGGGGGGRRHWLRCVGSTSGASRTIQIWAVPPCQEFLVQ